MQGEQLKWSDLSNFIKIFEIFSFNESAEYGEYIAFLRDSKSPLIYLIKEKLTALVISSYMVNALRFLWTNFLIFVALNE